MQMRTIRITNSTHVAYPSQSRRGIECGRRRARRVPAATLMAPCALAEAADGTAGDNSLATVVVEATSTAGPGVSPTGANDYAMSGRTSPTCRPGANTADDRRAGADARRRDRPEPADPHPQHRGPAVPVPDQRRPGAARHQHQPAVPLDDQPACSSSSWTCSMACCRRATATPPAAWSTSRPRTAASSPAADVSAHGRPARHARSRASQYGGCAGKFSYYVSGLYDQGETAFSSATPGPNPIHDYTHQGQALRLLLLSRSTPPPSSA